MSKRVEIGHIRGIVVHQGARHYSVCLSGGTTVLISEHHILPFPKTRLPRGTELALEYKTPTTIIARLQPLSPPANVSARPTLAPEAPPIPSEPTVLGIADGSLIAEPDPTWAPSPKPLADAKSADTALDKPIACPEIEPLFAPGGPVSKLLGRRYRPRKGQIQMANLVRDALKLGQHAFIEAGTGIGKSFAYLVPVIWSGTQAIVSTSNKALMEQLWTHDLPQLRRIAPHPFSAALLKGRSNYLCALRWEALQRNRALPAAKREYKLVKQKLSEVPSGDCELMRLPAKLWRKLAADRDTCQGRRCPAFRACLYERAKDRARASDLVVTNHALLCLNVLVGENRILPVRPVLIVDEAHELQRYAVHMLTRELVHGGLTAVVNHEITRVLIDEDEQREARETNQAFFEALYRLRPRPHTDPPSPSLGAGGRDTGGHRSV